MEKKKLTLSSSSIPLKRVVAIVILGRKDTQTSPRPNLAD